jgi:tetraacyldisaccharide 4'-kinase
VARDPNEGFVGGWAGFALEKAYLAAQRHAAARERARAVRADAPVVSIGNLVVGGTGKTPCTLWAAQALHDSNVRVAIVARPVGGTVPAAEGDEIALLRAGAPFAHVVASARKADGALQAARQLRAEAGPCAVLVDDGFSHVRLLRDLDIVLVDAARPIGNGHLLPRGPLREPPTALARAGLVIATRADRIEPARLDETLAALAKLAPQATLAAAMLVPVPLAGEGRDVACLSGLARPGELAQSARALGLNVVHDLCYPDHHRFSAGEWRAALRAAAPLDGGLLVSAKDAARLDPGQRAQVRVLRVDWRFLRGEDDAISRLRAVTEDS